LSIVSAAPIRHAARGRTTTRQRLAVAPPDLAAADLEQREDLGREFLGRAAGGTSAFGVVVAHDENLLLSITITLA
jgi:hypothetical protein